MAAVSGNDADRATYLGRVAKQLEAELEQVQWCCVKAVSCFVLHVFVMRRQVNWHKICFRSLCNPYRLYTGTGIS